MLVTHCAPHPKYEAVLLSSPANGEDGVKDQDRSAWDPQRLIACVCDGLTTSPYSTNAAEHLCLRLPEIMAGPQHSILPALHEVCDELLEMRAQSMNKPLLFDEAVPLALHEMLRDAVMRSMQFSFQSTAALLRVTETSDGACAARALWCGDTGIFVFRQDGKLAWSNLELAADGKLEHCAITHCLPEYPDNATLFDLEIELGESSAPIDEGISFLVASDGFYSAFPNCYDMWAWLKTHHGLLRCGGLAKEKTDAVQALHQGLIDRSGDDDISLVFVSPIEPAKG